MRQLSIAKQKGSISIFFAIMIISFITLAAAGQVVANYYNKKLDSQFCTDLTALYAASQIGNLDSQQLFDASINLLSINCNNLTPNMNLSKGFWDENEKEIIENESSIATTVKITYTETDLTVLERLLNTTITLKTTSIATNPNPTESTKSYLVK